MIHNIIKIMYSQPSTTEAPNPPITPFPDVPDSQPNSQIGQLLGWVYHIMHDVCSITYNGYTFNLWNVFIIVIICSILGWMLGKFLNPWSRDDD